MRSFTDNRGKQWPLSVDFTTVRHVRRLLGVDLVGLAPSDLLRRLESPLFFVDVLFALCSEDAKQDRISDEEFGRRCVMDLQPALDLLIEETADFFQMLGKTQHAMTLRMTWAMARIHRTLTESQLGNVFEQMERSIKLATGGSESGEPSTGTPQSLE
jgi:hypothetical protein